MEATFISPAEHLDHLGDLAHNTIRSVEEVLAENNVDRIKHVSVLKDLLVAQAIIARARRTLEDG